LAYCRVVSSGPVRGVLVTAIFSPSFVLHLKHCNEQHHRLLADELSAGRLFVLGRYSVPPPVDWTVLNCLLELFLFG